MGKKVLQVLRRRIIGLEMNGNNGCIHTYIYLLLYSTKLFVLDGLCDVLLVYCHSACERFILGFSFTIYIYIRYIILAPSENPFVCLFVCSVSLVVILL